MNNKIRHQRFPPHRKRQHQQTSFFPMKMTPFCSSMYPIQIGSSYLDRAISLSVWLKTLQAFQGEPKMTHTHTHQNASMRKCQRCAWCKHLTCQYVFLCRIVQWLHSDLCMEMPGMLLSAILKMLIAKRDYCSACLCSLACLLLFGLLGSLLFVVYQPWRHVFLFPPAKFLPKNIINCIMYSITIPNNISPKRRSFRDMSQKTKHWRLRSVALQDSYSAPKSKGSSGPK